MTGTNKILTAVTVVIILRYKDNSPQHNTVKVTLYNLFKFFLQSYKNKPMKVD